jgi:hypothetical protein
MCDRFSGGTTYSVEFEDHTAGDIDESLIEAAL